jgi:hypothetical protein
MVNRKTPYVLQKIDMGDVDNLEMEDFTKHHDWTGGVLQDGSRDGSRSVLEAGGGEV